MHCINYAKREQEKPLLRRRQVLAGVAEYVSPLRTEISLVFT